MLTIGPLAIVIRPPSDRRELPTWTSTCTRRLECDVSGILPVVAAHDGLQAFGRIGDGDQRQPIQAAWMIDFLLRGRLPLEDITLELTVQLGVASEQRTAARPVGIVVQLDGNSRLVDSSSHGSS